MKSHPLNVNKGKETYASFNLMPSHQTEEDLCKEPSGHADISISEANSVKTYKVLEIRKGSHNNAEKIARSVSDLSAPQLPSNNSCSLVDSVKEYTTPKSYSGAFDKSIHIRRSSSTIAPRLSGIGLHLNSIPSRKFVVQPPSQEKDLEVLVEQSVTGGKYLVPHKPRKSFLSKSKIGEPSIQEAPSLDSPMVYFATGHSEANAQENYQSSLNVAAVDNYLQFRLVGCSMTLSNENQLHPEDVCISKELAQMSTEEKRKKGPVNDGCKRCNCKRSKCLKLYCDCFAARTYCSEDCACEECFNRDEHENKVQETRQQVESRKPLAFASKVVLHSTDPHEGIDNPEHAALTLARHKTGCHCRKSQCLKKYCECYQVGVFCSFVCQCEGCQNTNGWRDMDERELLCKERRQEKLIEGLHTSSEEMGMEIQRDILTTKHCDSCLSPLTPSTQGSGKNDAYRPQLALSYYRSPSYMGSQNFPSGSVNNNSDAQTREEPLSLIRDQAIECNWTDELFASPTRWDASPPHACNISPLPNPSPYTGDHSATEVGGTLKTNFCRGSGRLSPDLRPHSSSITPLRRLGKGKFLLVGRANSHCPLLYHVEEDTQVFL